MLLFTLLLLLRLRDCASRACVCMASPLQCQFVIPAGSPSPDLSTIPSQLERNRQTFEDTLSVEEVTNRVRPQVIGEHSATKRTAFKHGSRIVNQKVPQWYVDEKRYDTTIKKIEARHQRNLDRESAYAALTAGQREMRFRNVQLFWQRSSDLLLHRWRISYRIEIARSRCRPRIWRRLVQRLLRRCSELLHFVCLRELIQPWLAVSSWGTFPVTWPAFHVACIWEEDWAGVAGGGDGGDQQYQWEQQQQQDGSW